MDYHVQCPACDRMMIPTKYDGRSRTADFVCSNEAKGVREMEQCSKEITVPAVLSPRLCPHCMEDGDSGHLIQLGVTQRTDGYRSTQRYHCQCLTCHKVSIEEVVMVDTNQYRVFTGYSVKTEPIKGHEKVAS